ncbi:uncharacterized protein LOC127705679 [Mytilus californianus]|uniref:uncharacterized protein LOC127705679 n=1 Tax=Mytilus californianus TaxID=6549 RepID=UPI00224540B8|nr:uncharacterized protein LOC127705679 [Mytilus californianus]
MASNWSVCGICDFRHVTKPSVVWCSECDEGLCDDCNEHHSISKSSRDHDIVPIDDYQNLPTAVLQIAQSCRKHNKKYHIFCKKHDCPCCKKCVVEEHNECKDIVDIDDAIKDVKSSNAFHEIELILSDMNKFIQRVKKDGEENLLSLADKKEQFEKKILQAREAINSHIDTLQKKLIEELNLTIDKENKNIQQFLKSVEQNEKEIKEFQSSLLKIKQHSSELQTFLALNQMENDAATKEEFMQSINDSGSLNHTRFFCKIDATLEKLTNNVKTFGEIVKETKPSDIRFVRQRDKQAQLMIPVQAKSIDDLTLTLIQSVNTYSSEVRGCTMLSDGRMVFTCYMKHGSYLTVVRPDGTKNFEIKSGYAYDVVNLDDNTIAVTSGIYSNNIFLIDVQLKNVKKTMHVSSSNDGMALKDKDLIYCGREKGLNKLCFSDNSVCPIIISKLSKKSYVTKFNESIIYTDPETNTVACTSVRGQINWKFKDESILKCPLGISVDNDGNVYVIGGDSCNVVVISPDRQRYRQILSANEGLTNPSVLHYDLLTNKLLVANFNGKAFLYDVSS